MRGLRHLTLALTLAFVLAIGQYAGLLHALGHATEQLSHKPGTPAKIACDQCFACSQLSSGGAPSLPVACLPQDLQEVQHAALVSAPSVASSVVFLSRAPPVLS